MTIPYAETLAELVPNRLVRMRRDFTQVLKLIQAHAVLYQWQRERDEDGRIVADRRDYEAVYGLVDSVFEAITAEGVTPAIRDTVVALDQLTGDSGFPTSYQALSEALGIDLAACRQRCAIAMKQAGL